MKKINKVRIIERLRDRFDLTDLDRETFTLPEKLLLTTDASDLLKQWRISASAVSKTHVSGSGWLLFFSCPEGKKYRVRVITLSRSAGDMTLTEIRLWINNAMVVYVQSAGANLMTGLLSQDIPMEEFNQLSVYCTAVSANSTWDVSVLYEEEDAF